jgi:ubiquitin carboxyl-terminal hydrolase 9/13
MLCERNKFHCDNCGGLQEAEKRMKIKRLPRVLALHLKRFKYTEDLQRLQKLFHRVVYPFHLRLFNTTEDTEDPDRLYELYAVVVHIGGGPYHGHYVSIIKTQDRGWLLFDDELVEPVDKSYVLNFFGGEPIPGLQDAKQLACAYVLFYQETTLEAVLKEQEMEGQQPAAAPAASRASDVETAKDGLSPTKSVPLQPLSVTTPVNEENEGFESLAHAATAPDVAATAKTPIEHVQTMPMSPIVPSKSKKEKKAEEKERKAAAKAEMKALEEKRRQASQRRVEAWKKQDEELKAVLEASKQTAVDEAVKRGEEPVKMGAVKEEKVGLSRFRNSSMSLRGKQKLFGGKDKDSEKLPALPQGQADSNGGTTDTTPLANAGAAEDKAKKNRFSLGRKKSLGLM